MMRLTIVAAMGLATALVVGCGGPLNDADRNEQPESALPGTQQDGTDATSSPGGEDGNVTASAYGCCALCWNRQRYHLVQGVDSFCTDRARDYCAVGDRGGLYDAAWGHCDP